MNPVILAPIVKKIVDEILNRIPDPVAREQARAELDKMQIEVNKQEAAHPSLWVAGWRPFIGWVGGATLAYQMLVRPMANGFGIPLPEVGDTQEIVALLGALLGFGGFRFVEKLKGAAK